MSLALDDKNETRENLTMIDWFSFGYFFLFCVKIKELSVRENDGFGFLVRKVTNDEENEKNSNVISWSKK